MGRRPIFCLCAKMVRAVSEHLEETVREIVEGLGYELVGVELAGGGHGANLVRVYIDSEPGIKLDDCERVSRQLGAAFDVEEPLAGRYDLEVSSPGLDRPLFNQADFERFTGHQADVRLHVKKDGRRRFVGCLRGVQDGDLLIEVDGGLVGLPLDQIDKARLVPEL